MTLNKDKSILGLLKRLPLSQYGWVTVDYWEADRCAIGIVHPDKPRDIVYINTYNNDEGVYDYECEVPNGPEISEYKATRTGEDVGYEDLLEVLLEHLK